MAVEEHTITVAGSPAFYRSAPQAGQPQGTPVFVHGAPGSSDDWETLLQRTGGIAPDLIGFGRSGKGGHLEYTPEALADFLGELLSELGVGMVQLVLHGWGAAAGVLLASRQPEKVQRLVLLNPVALLGGLHWPWWARAWRVPVLGELLMGATSRRALGWQLRHGAATAGAWSKPSLARVWEQFDQGTQRAILRLQRAVDEERIKAMRCALDSLTMPALIVWGERDPWWSPDVAEAYAAHLANVRLKRLAEAGHWPWRDGPAAADLVADFLQGRHNAPLPED